VLKYEVECSSKADPYMHVDPFSYICAAVFAHLFILDRKTAQRAFVEVAEESGLPAPRPTSGSGVVASLSWERELRQSSNCFR
jgi:hypothetical protein